MAKIRLFPDVGKMFLFLCLEVPDEEGVAADEHHAAVGLVPTDALGYRPSVRNLEAAGR